MENASFSLTLWPSVMEFALRMKELQPQCRSYLHHDKDICFMFRARFFSSLPGSLAERGTCRCCPQLVWALKPRPAGMRLCVISNSPCCTASGVSSRSFVLPKCVLRIAYSNNFPLKTGVLSNTTAKCEVAQMNGCWEKTITDGCSALWLYLCGCLNG